MAPRIRRARPRRRQWCDLPSELLDKISGCLDTQSDLRRFRSVCSSWRNSAPPPPPPQASRILHLRSFPGSSSSSSKPVKLEKFTVYSIQPLPSTTPQPRWMRLLGNFAAPTAPTRPWLVKLRFSESGTVSFLDLANSRSTVRETHMRELPKVVDLRDYHVREICSGYQDYGEPYEVNWCRFCETENGFMLMVVNSVPEPNLYVRRMGDDDEWTLVDVSVKGLLDFDSVMVGCLKGKFYVANVVSGLTVTVDPVSLEMKQVAPAKEYFSSGHMQKYLVASSQDLFLVEKLTPDELEIDGVILSYSFIVSKLDERRQEWVEGEEDMKDHVMFIANDWSALVPAELLPGYRRNYVFFVDDYGDQYCNHPASNFLACEIGGGPKEAVRLCPRSDCFRVFWPPPPWLNKNPL
ncbi:hypothetical protein Tsubulata_007323 [Turnera subulata]|uniref:F-box domain-containing protein n=1 Tax=Turnera subulata TaxID=218843 RepID=A0A9Q0FMZ2_9ROSI|nr:hypothetical protein Tsubulata_007323 [Turnera subulata]